jgi:hypothetical protein
VGVGVFIDSADFAKKYGRNFADSSEVPGSEMRFERAKARLSAPNGAEAEREFIFNNNLVGPSRRFSNFSLEHLHF